MSGWLYLIKNKDLYKIGITKNFENRMRQLKPDKIISKLYTRDYLKLEKELHYQYKKFRIPQTEYFRLEEHHLKEIKQRISKLEFTIIMFLEIFIKAILLIILIFVPLYLFLYLNNNDLNIILKKSIFWINRIIFGYPILSLFVNSGKYLSFMGELKYRFSMLSVLIFFSCFVRIVLISLK